MLATAIVYVKNRSGVLGSISKINFITSRFTNQLQLKSHRSSISISGIGKSSLVSNKSDYIFAQYSNANYSSSVAAAVTQLITDYHPHFDLNASDSKIPEHLELAEHRLAYWSNVILRNALYWTKSFRKPFTRPSENQTRLDHLSVSKGRSLYALIFSFFSSGTQPQSDSESISDILKRFC